MDANDRLDAEQSPGFAEDSGSDENDIGPMLDSVVGDIVRLIGSDAGLVSTWDPEHRTLHTTSSYGLDDVELRLVQAALEEELPELVGRGDNPMVAPGRFQGLDRHRSQQLLTVPLHSRGRLVGVLCLFQPEPAQRTGTGPIISDVPAGQFDLVLQNARLLQRIVEEKRWLEAVVEHAAEGILILDASGRMLGGNPAFYRLTGLRDSQIRGRFLSDVFDMPVRAIWDDGKLVDITIKDDRRRIFEANRSIIAGGQGEPLGGVLSLRDVTARREAEELQSTFFSVISHELKTPVAVIKGYADLLDEDIEKMEPAQVRRQLGVIREESDRLARMVENLLEATRIQSGALKLRPEPLAIGKLVQHVVKKMSTVNKSRRIVSSVAKDLPAVLGDWDRLEEVLTNLIDNAIKYSPEGGAIRVAALSLGTDVIVRVEDEGSGVPEIERLRIFDRFARLESGQVRKAKGAGLGLFICKSIVEAHGGRIWVESAPKGGARFAFSLPSDQTAQLPATVGFAGLLRRPDPQDAT